MFPPCTYAGHPKPGNRRFCRLKPPSKLVTLATCQACPHAEAFSTSLEPRCTPPLVDETEFPPCVHRGQKLRMDTTKVGCCGSVAVQVNACDVHRECTIKRCHGCLDATTPDQAKLGTLTGPANLMMFVYPRKSTRDIWTSQLETIRAALPRFDGRKLLAIATDDSTEAIEADVMDAFDDFVQIPNDPSRRELDGWRWAMEQLKDQPGFTVRLHAKGAFRGTPEQHLARWWELGYERLLDVDLVRESLQTHVVTGPFRRNMPAPNLGVPWHYSGSFYAFRNAEIFGAEWEPVGKVDPGWYVEAWPALVAPHELAGSVGWDGVGDLYQAKSWRDVPDVVADNLNKAFSRKSMSTEIQRNVSGFSATPASENPLDIQRKTENLQPPSVAPVSSIATGWEGDVTRKPWNYQVTAVIPIINTVDPLPLVIDTLRLQTERPYIVLVDTGSGDAVLQRLQRLRAEDVEIHSIRSHAWRHPSEPVTAAMDLALSMVHTPFIFCTHSDCFLKRRELLAEMVELAGRFKAVGYQLSPRKHPDWEWMLGHTCTMFDVVTLDDIDAAWSLRRLCNKRGVELTPEVCGPNWPDTELLINYQLRDAGITPHLIGSEKNFERTNDENIDHCRSLPSAQLYHASHANKSGLWMIDAMNAATERIEKWNAS